MTTLDGLEDDYFTGIDVSHLGESSTGNRDNATDLEICIMCQRELPRDIPVVRYAPDRLVHLECYGGLPLILHPVIAMELFIEDYGDTTWICANCNRPFVAARPMLYCTTSCKVAAANDRRRSPLSTCNCSECGDTFRAARSDATTCSARCRQRRARRITRESQIAAPPARSASTRDTTGMGDAQ